MRVYILFYHYKDISPFLTPWGRFRLWFQSKVTSHVHCNVMADDMIYELASWGGSLIPAHKYDFAPSKTVEITTTREDFNSFIHYYRIAALRRCPWICHLLALWVDSLDNCSTVTKPIVNYRATTPDKLLNYLEDRGNESFGNR